MVIRRVIGASLQYHSVTTLSFCTKEWQLSHVQLTYDNCGSEQMGHNRKDFVTEPQVTESYLVPVKPWLERFTQQSLLSLRNGKLVR